MTSFSALKKQVESGQFAPVYYLHGPESWFIDTLASTVEAHALQPGEDSFNKEVLFGAETTANAVMTACRSFPMMASRRLVMLKEAHRLPKAEWTKLVKYFSKPVATTVLVIVHKSDKGGAGKKGATTLEKAGGVVFESKKLYERDLKAWLSTFIQSKGIQADPQVPDILVTNLGTSVGHVVNELEKLLIPLQAQNQTQLTREAVFEAIDIDKDFNVFELISALGIRQVNQAHLIVDRLTQNAKTNPPVLIVGGLFRYFDQIAKVYASGLNDANAIRKNLGMNFFQARDALNGRRNYSLGIVYRNITYIQEADLQIKGQIPSQMGTGHILKTLVWKLLN
ncbi:MAG: DNA polymerase III subunit delta [Bacteroidia bacterium]